MIEIKHEKCDRCATCIAVCPVDVIRLTGEISVNQASCISCAACVRVCPYGALALTRVGRVQ